MTDLNSTKLDILEDEGAESEDIKVGKEEKNNNFPSGECSNISRTKLAMELHMKRKHNDKTIQYTPSPLNKKVSLTWFSCKSCKVKKRTENELQLHNKTVHMSVKKTLQKVSIKRPIQSFNCTVCNSTFDSRYKLNRHTREQHEGKIVKSPERKSARTESKREKQADNPNIEGEEKDHIETDIEEMRGETITIESGELENLQEILTQTGQENEQLKNDIKLWIKFKDSMIDKLTKAEGDNQNLTNEINIMRAAINTKEGSNKEDINEVSNKDSKTLTRKFKKKTLKYKIS